MTPPPRPRLSQRLAFRYRRVETLARVARAVLRTQGLVQLSRFFLRWLQRGLSGGQRAAPLPPATPTGPLQRRVAVIVPTYGQTTLVADCVASIHASLDDGSRPRVRVVVVDDGSEPSVQSALKRLPVDVLLREKNEGFAHAVNAGLSILGRDEDAVLLNNDTLAHRSWLERLQAAAYRDDRVGILGPKLLYPDGRIQSAGTYRASGSHQDWFDHYYRLMPPEHPPANVTREVLAVTGACMYIKRSVLDAIGPLDSGFPMAFEDVDYCLRARQAGYQVVYCPEAVLTHLEGHTRGERKEPREIVSQQFFWDRWRTHFDARRLFRTSPERLRIVYVTWDTGLAGGHRVAFEQMNWLADRGHEVELYSLAGSPKWFRLKVPVRTFSSREALLEQLANQEAIKVATWWETGELVWKASLEQGIPVFLVQDIETSYYEGDDEPTRRQKAEVLAGYRKEFRNIADATWTQERLFELGLDAQVVPPGIDGMVYKPAAHPRESNVVLSLGRSHPLKNVQLLLRGFELLKPRPSLWLFGIEPHIGKDLGVRYVYGPTDSEAAELYQRATVFVLTSRHEGFGLPILEAMACGCPVVCTDADGNMDFCRDGENCLIVPQGDPAGLAGALERVLADALLQERLREGGFATAKQYSWNAAIDKLETFFKGLAASGAPRAR